MAWKKVKANQGSGGVDGQTLETFEVQLEQQLERLQRELREDSYQPLPVRQHQIPKNGKPGEFRMLGIPAIYDRVCQQALLNRLEPIFEPLFDDASFGYRRGRSTKDAMRKVWKEIDSGREWIVDGDLQDFFGSVDHEKLLTLLSQRVADSRVLRLIKAMLKAGSYGHGKLFPSERGTPQGGVASPLLSNILLTPFDQEMRRRGYQLTRFADDWVITCKSGAEARAALAAATRILGRVGCAAESAEDADCPHPAGIRFSRVPDCAHQREKQTYPQHDPAMEFERVDRVSHTEINSTLPGSSADVDATQCPAKDSGADTGTKSDLARLGRVLQTSPRSNALPQTRRLDRAPHLVAPFPPVADPGLDTVAQGEAVRRVWLGESHLSNTFARFSLPFTSVFVKAVCRKSARTV